MADTINPNIPDFVVVSGATVPVTDDPRWVDGGIHYSAPDFNLDNPRMWTPMSVISGLASGFCERAAYVTGGSALGLKWVNAAPKENASNAAQAQKTANNMALAGGVESSFIQAKDPEFSLPVNMPFSNYMAAFDNALSTILLSPYGGYKTITGGTYTFDLLATAAYVRADGDIEQPSAGGWSYREPFDYTYPAQWAKERKWMLDELKYTSDPRPNHEFPSVIAVCATSNGLFPTVSSSAIGYAVRNSLYKQLISSCNSAGDGYGDIDLMARTSFGGYTSVRFNNAMQGAGAITSVYEGSNPYYLSITLPDTILEDSIGDAFSIYLDCARFDYGEHNVFKETDLTLVQSGTSIYVTDYANSYYGVHEGYTILAGATVHIGHAVGVFGSGDLSLGVLYKDGNTVCVPTDGRNFPVIAADSTGWYYLGPDNPAAASDYRVDISGTVYGVTTAIASGGSQYLVLASGTTPVKGSVGAVTNEMFVCVSGGGSLELDQTARVAAVNVMTGGTQTILGLSNGDEYPTVVGSSYNNYYGHDGFDRTYHIYTEGFTYSIVDDSSFSGILSNCAAVISTSTPTDYAEVDVYVLNGASLSLQGGNLYGTIRVCSGGTCTMSNIGRGGTPLAVIVEANGSCTIGPNAYLGAVSAYSESLCNINLTGTKACIETGLVVLHGATVNITGAKLVSSSIRTSSGEQNDIHISAILFDTYGMEGLTRGWNYGVIKETDYYDSDGPEVTCILGASSTDLNTCKAKAVAAAASVATISGVAGNVVLSGSTYTWNELFGVATNIEAWKSLMVTATNGGYIYRWNQLADHYQSFRCRQFYNNPDNPAPASPSNNAATASDPDNPTPVE